MYTGPLWAFVGKLVGKEPEHRPFQEGVGIHDGGNFRSRYHKGIVGQQEEVQGVVVAATAQIQNDVVGRKQGQVLHDFLLHEEIHVGSAREETVAGDELEVFHTCFLQEGVQGSYLAINKISHTSLIVLKPKQSVEICASKIEVAEYDFLSFLGKTDGQVN